MREEMSRRPTKWPFLAGLLACVLALLFLMIARSTCEEPSPAPPSSIGKDSSVGGSTDVAMTRDREFVIAGMREINDKMISSPQTLEQLRTTASKGVVESQLLLGKRFAVGDGVIKDDEEAIRWFKLASGSIIASLVRRAKGGDVEAMVELGRRYTDGIGLPADGVVALDWLRKAALKGHIYSQYDLACRLENGKGAPVDLVEAYAWYNIAAIGLGYAGASRDSLASLHPDITSLGQKRSRELLRQIEEAKASK